MGVRTPSSSVAAPDHAAQLVARARQAAACGALDEATRVFEEAAGLPSDDRFPRERAEVLGDIARIKRSKGEIDEAMKLHEERLRIFERLGDAEGKADTLWSMAQIEVSQSKPGEARQHLTESYAINLKLSWKDGICRVGLEIGPLLYAAGEKEWAIEVLERSRDGFGRLGLADEAKRARRLADGIRR